MKVIRFNQSSYFITEQVGCQSDKDVDDFSIYCLGLKDLKF